MAQKPNEIDELLLKEVFIDDRTIGVIYANPHMSFDEARAVAYEETSKDTYEGTA